MLFKLTIFRVGCWLLLAGSLDIPSPAGAQATPVRVADAACETCHTEIYRQYLQTPMANASGAAEEKLIPTRFLHQPSGTDYTVGLEQSKAMLTMSLPASGGQSGASGAVKRLLNYFLGSGHLGVTYLYSVNGFLFESPVAWYAASKGYDMKPGLGEMKQSPPAIPMQSSCLRCHMSSVQASDAGSLNHYAGQPFLHTGITCEACHGSTEAHVATKGKAAVVNPAKLTAEGRDSVCINCHLEGDVTVERAGHSALDYRPGESISTYLAFYIYGGANLTTRGVSEVEQFAQSQCKRMSGEAMSCTSCHDPHFSPSVGQRITYYRGKCLTCHTQPAFAKTHHAEQQDCTSCHMQRTGAENIPHVAWTDHRILKLPASAVTSNATLAGDELMPIFSPGATKRDLAMGYYKAMLEGNPALEPKATQQLKLLENDIEHDGEALDALAILDLQRGDAIGAERLLQKVLKVDPTNLIALTDLGTLLARDGKLQDAISLLQQAFDRNPDEPGLSMNLARVECTAGDGAGAIKTLETELVYNPNLPSVRRLLSEMSKCGPAAPRL